MISPLTSLSFKNRPKNSEMTKLKEICLWHTNCLIPSASFDSDGKESSSLRPPTREFRKPTPHMQATQTTANDVVVNEGPDFRLVSDAARDSAGGIAP
jgi:hypothetical protein